MPRAAARVRLSQDVPVPDARATLLLFVATDCPISNSYAPEIARIAAEYGRRGVACRAVYSDPDTTEGAARAHAARHRFTFAIARDPAQSLAHRCQITTTPEAAIVLPDGTCAYHGRIDDVWVEYLRRRPVATVRDLRAALDAVLAGRAAPPATGPTVGCPLPEPTR